MKQNFSFERIFSWVVLTGILATIVALALYGYLGTFSRYASDDYCLSAFFLRDGELTAKMFGRYQVSSSRYTNILFIGLVDQVFGSRSPSVLPPLMLGLFVFGMYLLIREISAAASQEWSRSFTLWLASLSVYFSVLQAPNLYETLYWRAGMTSHFAPLVFLPFFGTFLLSQIRRSGESVPPPWVRVVCLATSFILGGFSEPPVAWMIALLTLADFTVWMWGSVHSRKSALALLMWSLAGWTAALITLALAPANNLRLGGSPPEAVELVSRIAYYPILFIVDNVKVFPLPTVMIVAVTGLMFYAQHAARSRVLSKRDVLQLGSLLVIAFLLAYVLIAASFAPSVYGQNYPVARARFSGIVIWTCVLMLGGGIFGILVSGIRMNFPRLGILPYAGLLALFLVSLYPLRTTARLSVEIPAYRQRAAEWDEREAMIYQLKDEGVRELVVRRLPLELIQDLQNRTNFRLNRCASLIYDVDTILSIPMDE